MRPGLRAVWLKGKLVELMPAAVRTEAKIRLHQAEIARLKNFACSYRLGANSQGGDPVVASRQDNVITYDVVPATPGERRDP